MCSNAHCSSITDSPAVSGAGGAGGGVIDVVESETGSTVDRRVDGSAGKREGKHNNTAYT